MNSIEFKFRKLLSGKLTGGFRSFFKSSGIELEDFRKYEAGDDPKYINWKLSARHGEMFVKLFRQEKDADLHIFFDVNSNWNSGIDFINSQKVGDVFSDIVVLSKKYGANIVAYFPDGKKISGFPVGSNLLKASSVIKKVKKATEQTPKKYTSSLNEFIQSQKKVSKSHIIVIFSDFLDISDESSKLLKILSQKNETFLIQLNIGDFVGINFDKFSMKNADLKDLKLNLMKLDEFR